MLSKHISDTTLPCTAPSAKFGCSWAEIKTNRKININHNTLKSGTQKALNELCEEYWKLYLIDYDQLAQTKCDYFKCKISYLGHIISGKIMYPLPEKLQTIKNLPILKTPKEIRKMLGLTGCYQKIISAYVDLAWPLIKLTQKSIPFILTDQCQKILTH